MAAEGGGGSIRGGSPRSPLSSVSISSADSSLSKEETSIRERISRLRGTISDFHSGKGELETVYSDVLELREHDLSKRDVVDLSSALGEFKATCMPPSGVKIWQTELLKELILKDLGTNQEQGINTLKKLESFVNVYCEKLPEYNELKKKIDALEILHIAELEPGEYRKKVDELFELMKLIDVLASQSSDHWILEGNILVQSSQFKDLSSTMPEEAVLSGIIGFRSIASGLLQGAMRYEKKLGEGSFGTAYKVGSRVYKHIKDRDGRIARCVETALQESSVAFLGKAEGIAAAESIVMTKKREVVVLSKYGGNIGFDEAFLKSDKTPFKPRVDQVYKLVLSGLEALEKVHNSGLVHSDIKPDNMRIGKDGRATLIDFGLVQKKGEPVRGGTLKYCPPEFYLDSFPKADGARDLWALGAAMFKVLDSRASLLRILTHYSINKTSMKEILHSYCIHHHTVEGHIREILNRSMQDAPGKMVLIEAILLLISPDAKKRKEALPLLRKIEEIVHSAKKTEALENASSVDDLTARILSAL